MRHRSPLSFVETKQPSRGRMGVYAAIFGESAWRPRPLFARPTALTLPALRRVGAAARGSDQQVSLWDLAVETACWRANDPGRAEAYGPHAYIHPADAERLRRFFADPAVDRYLGGRAAERPRDLAKGVWFGR